MDIQVQVSTMDLLYGQYDAQIMLFSNSQSQSTRSIPVYLNYSEFGYTSLDNEDNQGSGNPDGDMDVLIGSSSSLAPIEFNIFLDEAEIYNAQLELLAQSVLPGHEHKVYVNNYLVGYLSAPTATMQNSYFNLDPTMLNSAPQIPNTVRIVPDALHYDSNGIMIMWGNITCNRDFSNASITELSYLPLMPVPGSQLSLKQYVQTNLNAQSVRVSSKLFNSAQEQVLNTQTRMMNLLAYQPSFTTVIWNLADIDPGSYYALVEVFDSNSNTLQDQMQLPIMILADEPMISPALQSLDFADVYPGYEYTLPLPISNLGAAELEVSSLSFSNPQFYCDVPQFSVASGSSYELLIHANLSSEGSQDATLSISSNDPANPSIGINLSATGVPAPQLMLSTSSISLQMDQYAYLPYSLSFSNIGLGDLTISEVQILGMDWLEYQLLGATLLPSEAGSLDLIFNSTGLEVGLYYGQIVLISNDPAQPQTTIQIIVEISPIALVAEFNADPISGYAPLEVSFSSLSYTTDGSQITSWEWDFNDDGIVDSVAENPSFSYSSSGSFAVTLKVTNDAGATHQTRKPDFIFVLNSAPQIAEALEAIQLTEDIPLLDFDLSPYFSDPDGDQLSYTVSESPNLTFSITGSLLSIYPAEDYYGSQQVLIHATDPYSASVSQNVWINVVAENDAPGFVELPPYLEFLRYTDYTVDFSPHVQDVDTDIQLLSISIAGNTNFTWQAQGLSITFSAPGDWFGEEEVTIILNDNFGRSISSETISIRILESLVASFTVSTTDVLAGVPLQFQNTSPGNITHFEWDFDNDSIVDSNEENPVHVYALGGAKSPRLKVMHKVDEDVIHQSEYTFVDGIFVRGTNIPGGNAVGSWVLENAPYNITGAIVVPADSLLSIDPEVQVNIVSEDVSITVRGSLQAESVNFSPISTDRWKGFVIENDVESLSLSNSRVQNAEIPFLIRGNASLSGCVIAKDSLLVFNQESGIAILDAEQVSLQNLDIQNYNTGIQIDSEFTASAPTLSNIRIRSSASAVRTDATGIKLSGQILPLFDNVEIENYSVGILYEGDNASLAAPPTISNVRIRNTSSTIRSLSTGIKILNLREVTVSQDSLSGCSTAIDIQNENPQLVNRPTISNIRIRNTGNTVRTQTTGIKLEGNLLLRMDDVDIEDYNNGISLIGTNNSLLTTPSTISNIRVRNTGNTVRETGIGIYIRDFPRITVINDSIFGYNEGIKLHNSNPALANKPTLSNIRIRNTGNTVRNSGTGISLMPGIFALVSDCLVQDYALGIRVLGTEADIRENRLVDNDLAIHLEQAAPQTRVEYNEILRTIWNDLNPATAISTDRCQDSKLYNNTIYNYGNALAAIGSVLEFKNNIVWAPALLEDIISSNSSTIAVDYNNFRLAEAWPGMGNLTLDPLFINEADLDLNLHYDSPMIDSGDPLLEPDPDGSTRDIGANIYLHKADFESDMRFVSPGQSIQFNNLSWGHPADISSFFWDFDNDGAIDSTIENPNWTPTELGRYDVKLVIQTGSLIDSLLLLNHVLVQTIQLNPPQNLRISVSYPDLQLSWDPVISDVFGDNASPDFYLCYANNAPNGTFRFVGETQGETDWTHSDAATTERMFYVVIGFTGTREDLMNFLGSRGSTIQISPALPPYHQNLKAKTKTP
jgi:PKD repeat protein